MIVTNFDATHVNIDGKVEPKIYRARAFGVDSVRLQQIYSNRDFGEQELFSNIEIDGIIYGTQEETIQALNLVVYSGVGGAVTISDENGTPVNITDDGYLSIEDDSSGLAISKGKVTGTSFIHKFGNAIDFDISDGFVTVWDGAEAGEPYEKMIYEYSTTADITTLSSDTVGNTQLTEIQGLDADYNLIIQTATLSGQIAVPLSTPLIRVFRVKNISNVDYSGHVFISVSGTLTGGVPTPTNLRAVVHGENNQTEMAVFTIPSGKTGYMRDWYVSTAGARRDSSHTIRLIARPFGQVFQLKHTANIDVNGTGYIKHNYTEPEVFTEKTDIEIRVNTNQNTAGISAGFDIVLIDN